MKQLLVYLLLCCIFYLTSAQMQDCCENGGILMLSKCSNGGLTWAKSNCPNGAYVLLGPDFTEIEHNSSLLITGTDHVITSDRFCLTAMDTENNTVALVCFGQQNERMDDFPGKGIVTIIAFFISITSLSLTLLVYIILPNLRDLQGKCMMNMIFSLIMSFLFLTIVQQGTNFSDNTCVAIASLIYFWFAAVFFWLNVISFNVWRSVVKPRLLSNKRFLYGFYNLYAWGGSVILLLITIICEYSPGHHIKPNMGMDRCWFKEEKAVWAYFYGPISVLILMNIGLFISTAMTFWKMEKQFTERKLKSHKFKFLLYLKLSLVMGICWIFEPLSALLYTEGSSTTYIWLVTDYINTLQGLIIFLLMVAFRKRVRRDLARRITCNTRLTKEWATIQDEECEELEEAQEELTSTVVDNTNAIA